MGKEPNAHNHTKGPPGYVTTLGLATPPPLPRIKIQSVFQVARFIIHRHPSTMHHDSTRTTRGTPLMLLSLARASLIPGLDPSAHHQHPPHQQTTHPVPLSNSGRALVSDTSQVLTTVKSTALSSSSAIRYPLQSSAMFRAHQSTYMQDRFPPPKVMMFPHSPGVRIIFSPVPAVCGSR